MPSLQSRHLRTVDVARRAGCSVQHVRNLERDGGVLPPATRTATGYRIYTDAHVQAALAYRELAIGAGPVEAKRIMRSVHTCPAATTVALLDAAHARLHAERTELALAKQAADVISTEPIDDVQASDWMSVSELAVALGIRPPSTLRHWDTEGLVVPDRDTFTGARRYSPPTRSATLASCISCERPVIASHLSAGSWHNSGALPDRVTSAPRWLPATRPPQHAPEPCSMQPLPSPCSSRSRKGGWSVRARKHRDEKVGILGERAQIPRRQQQICREAVGLSVREEL